MTGQSRPMMFLLLSDFEELPHWYQSGLEALTFSHEASVSCADSSDGAGP